MLDTQKSDRTSMIISYPKLKHIHIYHSTDSKQLTHKYQVLNYA